MLDKTHLTRRNFLQKTAVAPLAASLLGANFPTPRNSHKPVVRKFIPVMITPYHSNGSIHYDGVSKVIDFYLASGAKGFFANCLSSEMFYMTDDERVGLTRHVVKYVNGRVPVVSTGSFGKTWKDKVEFCKRIADTGVDAAILITSHFAEKSDSDQKLIQNFDQFFKQTGDIRLGTYECPNPYKRVLSAEVFKFLVSNPRMIYHKDTSESSQSIGEKLKIAQGSQLEFYNAHSATAVFSLQKGGMGMSPISGNFYPEIHTWLCQYATDPSKATDVKWIQEQITDMEAIIGRYYPISSKYFLQKRGLPIELTCRSNKRELPAEQKTILDNAVKTFYGWCSRLGIEPVRV